MGHQGLYLPCKVLFKWASLPHESLLSLLPSTWSWVSHFPLCASVSTSDKCGDNNSNTYLIELLWECNGLINMTYLKWFLAHQFSSVQFSHSVVSDSLRPHESQHARPPCPSPAPGVHSGSHPSSQWCHPAISSSVVPSSSCPQSLPASESFPMSQLFAWGAQSTGASALASFLPKKSQGWSPSE